MLLTNELEYGFRERMRKVHPDFLRDTSLTPSKGEFCFENGISVVLPARSGDVIKCASENFVSYLFNVMGVSALMSYEPVGKKSVTLTIDTEISEDYIIDVSDNIVIKAKVSENIVADIFELTSLSGSVESGDLMAIYNYGDNAKITLFVDVSFGNIQIDGEHSIITDTKVAGHAGQLYVKGDAVNLAWLDENVSRAFSICAVNVSEETVTYIAEEFAQYFD